jgi:hypothetical protein
LSVEGYLRRKKMSKRCAGIRYYEEIRNIEKEDTWYSWYSPLLPLLLLHASETAGIYTMPPISVN